MSAETAIEKLVPLRESLMRVFRTAEKKADEAEGELKTDFGGMADHFRQMAGTVEDAIAELKD